MVGEPRPADEERAAPEHQHILSVAYDMQASFMQKGMVLLQCVVAHREASSYNPNSRSTEATWQLTGPDTEQLDVGPLAAIVLFV